MDNIEEDQLATLISQFIARKHSSKKPGMSRNSSTKSDVDDNETPELPIKVVVERYIDRNYKADGGHRLSTEQRRAKVMTPEEQDQNTSDLKYIASRIIKYHGTPFSAAERTLEVAGARSGVYKTVVGSESRLTNVLNDVVERLQAGGTGKEEGAAKKMNPMRNVVAKLKKANLLPQVEGSPSNGMGKPAAEVAKLADGMARPTEELKLPDTSAQPHPHTAGQDEMASSRVTEEENKLCFKSQSPSPPALRKFSVHMTPVNDTQDSFEYYVAQDTGESVWVLPEDSEVVEL